MKNIFRFIAAPVAALCLCLAPCASAKENEEEKELSKVATALTAENLEFVTKARPKTDAKVYYIYVSRSTCPPCVAATTLICGAYKRLGKDAEVVMLNCDKDIKTAERWVKGKVKYPVIAPGSRLNLPRGGGSSLPNMIVLDADGNTLGSASGSPDALMNQINKSKQYVKEYNKKNDPKAKK